MDSLITPSTPNTTTSKTTIHTHNNKKQLLLQAAAASKERLQKATKAIINQTVGDVSQVAPIVRGHQLGGQNYVSITTSSGRKDQPTQRVNVVEAGETGSSINGHFNRLTNKNRKAVLSKTKELVKYVPKSSRSVGNKKEKATIQCKTSRNIYRKLGIYFHDDKLGDTAMGSTEMTVNQQYTAAMDDDSARLQFVMKFKSWIPTDIFNEFMYYVVYPSHVSDFVTVTKCAPQVQAYAAPLRKIDNKLLRYVSRYDKITKKTSKRNRKAIEKQRRANSIRNIGKDTVNAQRPKVERSVNKPVKKNNKRAKTQKASKTRNVCMRIIKDALESFAPIADAKTLYLSHFREVLVAEQIPLYICVNGRVAKTNHASLYNCEGALTYEAWNQSGKFLEAKDTTGKVFKFQKRTVFNMGHSLSMIAPWAAEDDDDDDDEFGPVDVIHPVCKNMWHAMQTTVYDPNIGDAIDGLAMARMPGTFIWDNSNDGLVEMYDHQAPDLTTWFYNGQPASPGKNGDVDFNASTNSRVRRPGPCADCYKKLTNVPKFWGWAEMWRNNAPKSSFRSEGYKEPTMGNGYEAYVNQKYDALYAPIINAKTILKPGKLVSVRTEFCAFEFNMEHPDRKAREHLLATAALHYAGRAWVDFDDTIQPKQGTCRKTLRHIANHLRQTKENLQSFAGNHFYVNCPRNGMILARTDRWVETTCERGHSNRMPYLLEGELPTTLCGRCGGSLSTSDAISGNTTDIMKGLIDQLGVTSNFFDDMTTSGSKEWQSNVENYDYRVVALALHNIKVLHMDVQYRLQKDELAHMKGMFVDLELTSSGVRGSLTTGMYHAVRDCLLVQTLKSAGEREVEYYNCAENVSRTVGHIAVPSDDSNEAAIVVGDWVQQCTLSNIMNEKKKKIIVVLPNVPSDMDRVSSAVTDMGEVVNYEDNMIFTFHDSTHVKTMHRSMYSDLRRARYLTASATYVSTTVRVTTDWVVLVLDRLDNKENIEASQPFFNTNSTGTMMKFTLPMVHGRGVAGLMGGFNIELKEFTVNKKLLRMLLTRNIYKGDISFSEMKVAAIGYAFRKYNTASRTITNMDVGADDVMSHAYLATVLTRRAILKREWVLDAIAEEYSWAAVCKQIGVSLVNVLMVTAIEQAGIIDRSTVKQLVNNFDQMTVTMLTNALGNNNFNELEDWLETDSTAEGIWLSYTPLELSAMPTCGHHNGYCLHVGDNICSCCGKPTNDKMCQCCTQGKCVMQHNCTHACIGHGDSTGTKCTCCGVDSDGALCISCVEHSATDEVEAWPWISIDKIIEEREVLAKSGSSRPNRAQRMDEVGMRTTKREPGTIYWHKNFNLWVIEPRTECTFTKGSEHQHICAVKINGRECGSLYQHTHASRRKPESLHPQFVGDCKRCWPNPVATMDPDTIPIPNPFLDKGKGREKSDEGGTQVPTNAPRTEPLTNDGPVTVEKPEVNEWFDMGLTALGPRYMAALLEPSLSEAFLSDQNMPQGTGSNFRYLVQCRQTIERANVGIIHTMLNSNLGSDCGYTALQMLFSDLVQPTLLSRVVKTKNNMTDEDILRVAPLIGYNIGVLTDAGLTVNKVSNDVLVYCVMYQAANVNTEQPAHWQPVLLQHLKWTNELISSSVLATKPILDATTNRITKGTNPHWSRDLLTEEQIVLIELALHDTFVAFELASHSNELEIIKVGSDYYLPNNTSRKHMVNTGLIHIRIPQWALNLMLTLTEPGGNDHHLLQADWNRDSDFDLSRDALGHLQAAIRVYNSFRLLPNQWGGKMPAHDKVPMYVNSGVVPILQLPPGVWKALDRIYYVTNSGLIPVKLSPTFIAGGWSSPVAPGIFNTGTVQMITLKQSCGSAIRTIVSLMKEMPHESTCLAKMRDSYMFIGPGGAGKSTRIAEAYKKGDIVVSATRGSIASLKNKIKVKDKKIISFENLASGVTTIEATVNTIFFDECTLLDPVLLAFAIESPYMPEIRFYGDNTQIANKDFVDCPGTRMEISLLDFCKATETTNVQYRIGEGLATEIDLVRPGGYKSSPGHKGTTFATMDVVMVDAKEVINAIKEHNISTVLVFYKKHAKIMKEALAGDASLTKVVIETVHKFQGLEAKRGMIIQARMGDRVYIENDPTYCMSAVTRFSEHLVRVSVDMHKGLLLRKRLGVSAVASGLNIFRSVGGSWDDVLANVQTGKKQMHFTYNADVDTDTLDVNKLQKIANDRARGTGVVIKHTLSDDKLNTVSMMFGRSIIEIDTDLSTMDSKVVSDTMGLVETYDVIKELHNSIKEAKGSEEELDMHDVVHISHLNWTVLQGLVGALHAMQGVFGTVACTIPNYNIASNGKSLSVYYRAQRVAVVRMTAAEQVVDLEWSSADIQVQNILVELGLDPTHRPNKVHSLISNHPYGNLHTYMSFNAWLRNADKAVNVLIKKLVAMDGLHNLTHHVNQKWLDKLDTAVQSNVSSLTRVTKTSSADNQVGTPIVYVNEARWPIIVTMSTTNDIRMSPLHEVLDLESDFLLTALDNFFDSLAESGIGLLLRGLGYNLNTRMAAGIEGLIMPLDQHKERGDKVYHLVANTQGRLASRALKSVAKPMGLPVNLGTEITNLLKTHMPGLSVQLVQSAAGVDQLYVLEQSVLMSLHHHRDEYTVVTNRPATIMMCGHQNSVVMIEPWQHNGMKLHQNGIRIFSDHIANLLNLHVEYAKDDSTKPKDDNAAYNLYLVNSAKKNIKALDGPWVTRSGNMRDQIIVSPECLPTDVTSVETVLHSGNRVYTWVPDLNPLLKADAIEVVTAGGISHIKNNGISCVVSLPTIWYDILTARAVHHTPKGMLYAETLFTLGPTRVIQLKMQRHRFLLTAPLDHAVGLGMVKVRVPVVDLDLISAAGHKGILTTRTFTTPMRLIRHLSLVLARDNRTFEDLRATARVILNGETFTAHNIYTRESTSPSVALDTALAVMLYQGRMINGLQTAMAELQAIKYDAAHASYEHAAANVTGVLGRLMSASGLNLEPREVLNAIAETTPTHDLNILRQLTIEWDKLVVQQGHVSREVRQHDRVGNTTSLTDIRIDHTGTVAMPDSIGRFVYNNLRYIAVTTRHGPITDLYEYPTITAIRGPTATLGHKKATSKVLQPMAPQFVKTPQAPPPAAPEVTYEDFENMWTITLNKMSKTFKIRHPRHKLWFDSILPTIIAGRDAHDGAHLQAAVKHFEEEVEDALDTAGLTEWERLVGHNLWLMNLKMPDTVWVGKNEFKDMLVGITAIGTRGDMVPTIAIASTLIQAGADVIMYIPHAWVQDCMKIVPLATLRPGNWDAAEKLALAFKANNYNLEAVNTILNSGTSHNILADVDWKESGFVDAWIGTTANPQARLLSWAHNKPYLQAQYLPVFANETETEEWYVTAYRNFMTNQITLLNLPKLEQLYQEIRGIKLDTTRFLSAHYGNAIMFEEELSGMERGPNNYRVGSMSRPLLGQNLNTLSEATGVLLTFGSMLDGVPDMTYMLIAEALVRTKQRIHDLHLINLPVGRFEQLGLVDTIGNEKFLNGRKIKIHSHNNVDLRSATKMGLIIHHGGAGTTIGFSETRVNQVIIPVAFDQSGWGESITKHKMGTCLKMHGKIEEYIAAMDWYDGRHDHAVQPKPGTCDRFLASLVSEINRGRSNHDILAVPHVEDQNVFNMTANVSENWMDLMRYGLRPTDWRHQPEIPLVPVGWHVGYATSDPSIKYDPAVAGPCTLHAIAYATKEELPKLESFAKRIGLNNLTTGALSHDVLLMCAILGFTGVVRDGMRYETMNLNNGPLVWFLNRDGHCMVTHPPDVGSIKWVRDALLPTAPITSVGTSRPDREVNGVTMPTTAVSWSHSGATHFGANPRQTLSVLRAFCRKTIEQLRDGNDSIATTKLRQTRKMMQRINRAEYVPTEFTTWGVTEADTHVVVDKCKPGALYIGCDHNGGAHWLIGAHHNAEFILIKDTDVKMLPFFFTTYQQIVRFDTTVKHIVGKSYGNSLALNRQTAKYMEELTGEVINVVGSYNVDKPVIVTDFGNYQHHMYHDRDKLMEHVNQIHFVSTVGGVVTLRQDPELVNRLLHKGIVSTGLLRGKEMFVYHGRSSHQMHEFLKQHDASTQIKMNSAWFSKPLSDNRLKWLEAQHDWKDDGAGNMVWQPKPQRTPIKRQYHHQELQLLAEQCGSLLAETMATKINETDTISITPYYGTYSLEIVHELEDHVIFNDYGDLWELRWEAMPLLLNTDTLATIAKLNNNTLDIKVCYDANTRVGNSTLVTADKDLHLNNPHILYCDGTIAELILEAKRSGITMTNRRCECANASLYNKLAEAFDVICPDGVRTGREPRGSLHFTEDSFMTSRDPEKINDLETQDPAMQEINLLHVLEATAPCPPNYVDGDKVFSTNYRANATDLQLFESINTGWFLHTRILNPNKVEKRGRGEFGITNGNEQDCFLYEHEIKEISELKTKLVIRDVPHTNPAIIPLPPEDWMDDRGMRLPCSPFTITGLGNGKTIIGYDALLPTYEWMDMWWQPGDNKLPTVLANDDWAKELDMRSNVDTGQTWAKIVNNTDNGWPNLLRVRDELRPFPSLLGATVGSQWEIHATPEHWAQDMERGVWEGWTKASKVTVYVNTTSSPHTKVALAHNSMYTMNPPCVVSKTVMKGRTDVVKELILNRQYKRERNTWDFREHQAYWHKASDTGEYEQPESNKEFQVDFKIGQTTKPYAIGAPPGAGKTHLSKLMPGKFADHDDYLDQKEHARLVAAGDMIEVSKFHRNVSVPTNKMLLTWGPFDTPKTHQFIGYVIPTRTTHSVNVARQTYQRAARVRILTQTVYPVVKIDRVHDFGAAVNKLVQVYEGRKEKPVTDYTFNGVESLGSFIYKEGTEPPTPQVNHCMSKNPWLPYIPPLNTDHGENEGIADEAIPIQVMNLWEERDQTDKVVLFAPGMDNKLQKPHSAEQPNKIITTTKVTLKRYPVRSRPVRTKMFAAQTKAAILRMENRVVYKKDELDVDLELKRFAEAYFKTGWQSIVERWQPLYFDPAAVNKWLHDHPGSDKLAKEVQEVLATGFLDDPLNLANVHAKLESLLKSNPIMDWTKEQVRIIVWQSKGKAALFSVFNEAKNRLKMLLNDKTIYADGLSPDDLSARLRAVPNDGAWILESDLEKQDKQTEGETLDCEMEIYKRYLKVHYLVVNLWRRVHDLWRYKGTHIRGMSDGMRWTGQITTALGNVIVCMLALMLMVILMWSSLLIILFLGDDNLTITKRPPDATSLRSYIKNHWNMLSSATVNKYHGTFLQMIVAPNSIGTFDIGPDWVRLRSRFEVTNGGSSDPSTTVLERCASYAMMLGDTDVGRRLMDKLQLDLPLVAWYDVPSITLAIQHKYSKPYEWVRNELAELEAMITEPHLYYQEWEHFTTV
ncbi:polyprotein [Helicobasidium mompa endornavirus 1]|uniref:Polyprotein n=1 Tax=Helicobasidium mompa endornavirus 1-670 TaxID=675833 RepID=Q1HAY3_HMEV|nr:polyprotein [Helicobasidium mompa alphaendornavirus 1]BAE94538.1 polyprotein [Helicobasidium mompa alphaendornavirus 1]